MGKMRKIFSFFVLLLAFVCIQNATFANSFSVPFVLKGNTMFINAKVNNHKGNFMVDTGASFCVLYKNFSDKYKIKPNTNDIIRVRTADGDVVDCHVLVGNITLGSKTFNNVKILLMPASDSSDGLIGGNILNTMTYKIKKDYGKITFFY